VIYEKQQLASSRSSNSRSSRC